MVPNSVWINSLLLIGFAVVGNLINAAFVLLVASWISKKKVTYKNAYLSLLIGSLVSIVGGGVISFFKQLGVSDRAIGWLPGSVFLFFGGGIIQTWMLAELCEMSFGKAFWVLLVTGFIEGTILLACIGLFILLSAAPR
jgi:hypothetical protein